MLDLVEVVGQLGRMRADLAGLEDERGPRLDEALRAWERARDLGPALADRVGAARTSWLVAQPMEVLHPAWCATAGEYRVLASDGSQVFRDRHELPDCYLVNVGLVDIDYSCGRARLGSVPTIAYLPDDIYPLIGGGRQEADARVVAARRFATECDELARAMCDLSAETPTLALMDGTMLLWWLETDPDRLRVLDPSDEKSRTFAAFARLLAAAQERDVLLAGYLSAPGATDVVSMLKVVLCTEDPVDCDHCPYSSGGKEWRPLRGPARKGLLPPPSKPCEEAETATDAALFDRLLEPGQRSPRFRSAARVTDAYPAPIDFVYVHTGVEIARLEVGAWTTPQQLDVLCALVLDQCEKGRGYPVSLSEAHEQAVVRAADRRAFLDLVRRTDPAVSRLSAKMAMKRRAVL